jgi:hypothetical protein
MVEFGSHFVVNIIIFMIIFCYACGKFANVTQQMPEKNHMLVFV